MSFSKIDIQKLIIKASAIIAPLWPIQTIIARNPLQGMESLNFKDAIVKEEQFLGDEMCVSEKSAEAINREMIKWCQVFLDEGQAGISMPGKSKGFYRAWALLAPFDINLKNGDNNKWLLSLPEDPEEAILLCISRLNIPHEEIEDYFKYIFKQLPGWAGIIKYRNEWQNNAHSNIYPISLMDFVAVRLVIRCAIEDSWEKKKHETQPSRFDFAHKKFFYELERKEEYFVRNLLKPLIQNMKKAGCDERSPSRPLAQIVFCIDVRSEPIRLRIEHQGHYETFGFAGFFGLPISIHNCNSGKVKDFCPVLLKPSFRVSQEPTHNQTRRIIRHTKGKNFFYAMRKAYKDLKYNFGTPFALVETLGVWCGIWMGIRTLMPTTSAWIKKTFHEFIQPDLLTYPKIDIPLENQIQIAETVLKTMGLIKNFSQIVLFCGHRSQTENNPYSSALDCGACGGNHGGANGRILADILNLPSVRTGLKEKGIIIPDDTLFLGAEHNTTTDAITIDAHQVTSERHQKLIANLKIDLDKASVANSAQRYQNLGGRTFSKNIRKQVTKRSCDWSEVRPEWGLAGNAAFIVASRDLTRNHDLKGKCFLHSYEWREDHDGSSLEKILTAPMVVAEWINTQYFFSSLNNRIYGSGSKITHNVTGKLGIMQGNGSDLMQGLPLQSVSLTDDHLFHDPMRLQVIINAPRPRIDSIIQKHEHLQQLVFNQWVILVAIDPIHKIAYRLQGMQQWEEML